MPVGSVVLTPGTPPVSCDLPTLDLSSETPRESDWIPVVSLTISRSASQLPEPVLLVLAGHDAVHAPGLGFAQRSARRSIAGYLLVDPVLPSATAQDWPDAPVTVVITPDADDDSRSAGLAALLRGWEVLETPFVEALGAIVHRP